MQEIWKDIRGYENYEVSNLGEVRNKQTMKILKPGENKKGYFQISLSNGGKKKTFPIHRLVACAFLENPNMLPQVNHKDENKKNNCVDNLEFCTARYNINFGTRTQKATKKLSKPVFCIETGEVFASAKDAQRQKGYWQASINHVCNGKQKTVGGYHWKYA